MSICFSPNHHCLCRGLYLCGIFILPGTPGRSLLSPLPLAPEPKAVGPLWLSLPGLPQLAIPTAVGPPHLFFPGPVAAGGLSPCSTDSFPTSFRDT